MVPNRPWLDVLGLKASIVQVGRSLEGMKTFFADFQITMDHRIDFPKSLLSNEPNYKIFEQNKLSSGHL